MKSAQAFRLRICSVYSSLLVTLGLLGMLLVECASAPVKSAGEGSKASRTDNGVDISLWIRPILDLEFTLKGPDGEVISCELNGGKFSERVDEQAVDEFYREFCDVAGVEIPPGQFELKAIVEREGEKVEVRRREQVDGNSGTLRVFIMGDIVSMTVIEGLRGSLSLVGKWPKKKKGMPKYKVVNKGKRGLYLEKIFTVSLAEKRDEINRNMWYRVPARIDGHGSLMRDVIKGQKGRCENSSLRDVKLEPDASIVVCDERELRRPGEYRFAVRFCGASPCFLPASKYERRTDRYEVVDYFTIED